MRYIRPFLALVLVLHHVAVVAETPPCSEQMGTNINDQDCTTAFEHMWEVAHNPDKRPVPYLPWEVHCNSCEVHVNYLGLQGNSQPPEQLFSSEVQDAARYIIWHCVLNHKGSGGQIRIKGLEISIKDRYSRASLPLYHPGIQAASYLVPPPLQLASDQASQRPRSPLTVIETHEADHLLPQVIKDTIGQAPHQSLRPPRPPGLPRPRLTVPPLLNTHGLYQHPTRHGVVSSLQSSLQSSQTRGPPPGFSQHLRPGLPPSSQPPPDRPGLST
jgi:hypothetical protein